VAPESRPALTYPQIDLDRIVPNHRQPRERFEPEALQALANSLKNQGVLQPVLVRPLPDGRYALVAGERRWRAAQLAGLLKIPAVIRDIPEDRVLEFALIENVQREELNPIEEARAYRALVDDVGLTQAQIAERVGRQRATVANSLRLLGLAEPVQQMLRKGELSAGHGRAIAGVDSPSEQIRLATLATRDGVSVRELEAQVGRLQKEGDPIARAKPGPKKDPNVAAAEEKLQRTLGTKVRIFQDKKGAGRLEVHFFSADELERLFQLLIQLGHRIRKPTILSAKDPSADITV
jgi:ParB family chromosome partitioning protein